MTLGAFALVFIVVSVVRLILGVVSQRRMLPAKHCPLGKVHDETGKSRLYR